MRRYLDITLSAAALATVFIAIITQPAPVGSPRIGGLYAVRKDAEECYRLAKILAVDQAVHVTVFTFAAWKPGS